MAPNFHCAICDYHCSGDNPWLEHLRSDFHVKNYSVKKYSTLPAKHAFNEAVETTLGACLKISEQRGGEYQDTWALTNQVTHFSDMVDRETAGDDMTKDVKRLRIIAAICDVKVSRLLGPFKEDTLDDLINYVAALRHWMVSYRQSHRVLGQPQQPTEAELSAQADFQYESVRSKPSATNGLERTW